MPCVFVFYKNIGCSFHANSIFYDAHIFPLCLIAILILVLRIEFIHIKVFCINSKNGETPGSMVVVAN